MSYDSVRSFLSTLTLQKLLPVLIVLVAGSFIIHVLLKLFEKGLAHSRLERGMHAFLKQVMRILLWFLLILIMADLLGINTSSLVALLSVVSLAFSLAVQNSLADVVGGITILTTHPFQAGDYVEIGGNSGTVQSVSMTYTVILTPDGKTLNIPNSDTAAAVIINYTRNGKRRIELTFTAGYESETPVVLEALLACPAGMEKVLPDPAPEAYVSSYQDSAIEYLLRCWVTPDDYWEVYYALTEKVRREFDARGVIMTYPHLNVHVDKLSD